MTMPNKLSIYYFDKIITSFDMNEGTQLQE